MPQHRQPVPLLSLCYTQVSTDLVSTCRLLQLLAQDSSAAHALSLARRRLRGRYVSHLPGSVRSKLIDEASRLLSAPTPDGSANGGPAPLYLLALLLAPDVHHLRIELCCYYGCSHQAALLQFLATEGKGLETLELARSALLRLDRSLLHTALVSAVALKELILRNIARDSIMQVIGSSCYNLTLLDVSHSRQVTDAGLRHLFLQVELRDKDSDALLHLSESENASSTCGNRGWGRLRILLRLFPWLRTNREGESKLRERSFLLEYCERRNPLCETLQILNVANTGVTSAGILLALHHVPGLQSLGEYGHMGRALEILHRAWNATTWQGDSRSPPSFSLTAVRSQRTTIQRIEFLARACPGLKRLHISEPHHPPSALRLFPSSLTTLHLHSIPKDSQWIRGLYSFLATSQGRNLQNLSLRFFANEFIASLDLSQIMLHCPNLETYVDDGVDTDWKQQIDSNVNMPRLRSVQLGRTVTARALTELLKRAPALEIAHFYSCPDLKDQHLMSITAASTMNDQGIYDHTPILSQNLECFYIYEASHVTAPAVVSLLASCEQLLSIGNLANWDLDCERIRWIHATVRNNNLNLEINTGSHWFCSQCFPS